MPNQWDLTGENIENTYQRVLQTPDGVNIFDGTGSAFTVTAVAAPAGPDQSVQFRDGSSTSGSGNFTFNKIDNIVNVTGSLIATSFTGSFQGTASWAYSASQALTSSYYQETDPIFVAKSASLATTGSNIFVGNQVVSGSITTTGSVGIGTPTPTTLLHVRSGSSNANTTAVSSTAVFESNHNTYVSIFSSQSQNSGIHFGSNADPLGAYLRWNQDNNLMTFGTANDGDNISFVTGDETSSMYLKNNVGLGIGTTAPLYKLHVRNGAVTNNSTWGGSVGVFENSGSNAYLSVLSSDTYVAGIGFGTADHRVSAQLNWASNTKAFNLATNTASAFLTFGTDVGDERMRITSNGLVGIGTTAPQYMLDVSGSARITSSLYLPGLTTEAKNNVVTVDISTGQLYYTASSAFGGGSSTPTFPYTGSAIISGSLTVTGSLNTNGYISSYKSTASQEIFSTASYVAGDIIQGTIDVGVSQWNLAYLDTTGTWKNVDQTTATSTKMLGIYLGGDQILLDGHISANTDGVGITIGPSIQTPNDGLPVYIDPGPISQFNTIIPVANYIRTLGYLYYNNSITNNYWILKFRPSNDWYKI